jgi:hypothetical protein
MQYPTKFEARKALADDGYRLCHTAPGTPMLWVREQDGIPDRRCVYGNDTVGWQLVAYPTLNWMED